MKELRRCSIAILSFILIFILLFIAVQNTSKSSKENQKISLEKSVYRGILECYALEGKYPESLNYLIKEYDILYNEDEYVIEYEVIASNILPVVTIIEKK